MTMAIQRHLPEERNPLLAPKETKARKELPSHDSLIKRRRLGQTDLTSKPGQVGTVNATIPKNLGTFDYAHLRVPLPKNMTSPIFPAGAPPSYFLMRRSRDGYVSATGMFKATFPWATVDEEETERKYIKNLDTTSPDETAGNVWIPAEHAVELAAEYDILPWILALLDNEEIEVNSSARESSPKVISPPPKFLLLAESLPPPTPTRGRARRSASPSKIASPKKAIATPRKPKVPKAATMDASTGLAAKKALKQSVKPVEDAKKADDDSESSEVVRVIVETDVKVDGDIETTHTHVEVEMPAGSPELPLPEDTTSMIEKAKEMVEAARKADAEPTVVKPARKSKRKADVIEADKEEADKEEESGPVVKKVKVEAELKRERVKKRALIGISATLAVGALIPYVFNVF